MSTIMTFDAGSFTGLIAMFTRMKVYLVTSFGLSLSLSYLILA